jgi:hypothetical protein
MIRLHYPRSEGRSFGQVDRFYVRRHHLALLALFVALGGTSVARRMRSFRATASAPGRS